MMKTSKLMLSAFLILFTVLHLIDTKVADDNSFATMSAITAKGARLTAALNALSLFVQSSLDGEEVFREAISSFFTYNRSVIDDIAEINETHLSLILNELGNIGNETFSVTVVSNSLDELGRTNENLKDLPSLKELFKDAIPSSFGDIYLKTVDMSHLDENIEKLSIKNFEFTLTFFQNLIPSSSEDAIQALIKIPSQIKEIIEMFSIDDIISKATSVITPLAERIAAYELLKKDEINSILSIRSTIFEEVNSFRKAANVAKSMSSMCRKMMSTDTFINLTVLEEDLKDPTFLDTLNEERSSEALEIILPPIFEISKKVKSHWTGIEDILRNKEFRTSSEKLNRVLSFLIEAVPQKIAFQSSLKSIGELFNLIEIPIDATAFQEFSLTINRLKELDEDVKRLKKTDDFENMIVQQKVFDLLRSNRTYRSDLIKGTEFPIAVQRFKNISYYLDNLNDIRRKMNIELKDLKWRHLGKKIDEWIKTVFIPFEKKMKESSEVIKRLKSALNFLKERKNLNLPNFHSQIVSLQKKTQEVKGVVEEELKNLNPKEENEPYYKYMINLRIESSPLREQLMRASHIFGLLDHYDRNQTVFDEFFEKGIALQKKILNDNSKTEDQKTKMNELESMKKRMDDLKEQMNIRMKRYAGKSMKELFEMRSFIDNLQNLPNPALRVNEWRSIAQSIGGEADDFNASIDAIFDFDFTLHQRNLIGTFSNYKGYVRYNQIIPKIGDIQKRTFYESNYGPIEFAIFVVESLLVNILLYAAACYQLRQLDKKEVVREKRLRSDYYRMFAAEFDAKRGFVKK